jgi:hypothetical protein
MSPAVFSGASGCTLDILVWTRTLLFTGVRVHSRPKELAVKMRINKAKRGQLQNIHK